MKSSHIDAYNPHFRRFSDPPKCNLTNETMVDSFDTTIAAAVRAGVRFDDASQPTVHRIRQNDEFELNFVDWGDETYAKPALIFIHGFLQQARTWDFTCLALRSRFRCISLDLRGHGDSGRPFEPDYTTHHYLSDLRRLIDHLSEEFGIDRFGLCGLSLGGTLSYLHASENPNSVHAIVVVDVAPEMNREARRGIRRYIEALPKDGPFDALVDKVAKLSPMRNRDAVRGSLLRATIVYPDGTWDWKNDQRLFDYHRPSFNSDDYWAALEKVTVPSLFVIGQNSKLVTPETVRRMIETVPGSSATYVPKASHRVPGDNPIGFIKAVSPFLDRYVPKSDVGRHRNVKLAPT